MAAIALSAARRALRSALGGFRPGADGGHGGITGTHNSPSRSDAEISSGDRAERPARSPSQMAHRRALPATPCPQSRHGCHPRGNTGRHSSGSGRTLPGVPACPLCDPTADGELCRACEGLITATFSSSSGVGAYGRPGWLEPVGASGQGGGDPVGHFSGAPPFALGQPGRATI